MAVSKMKLHRTIFALLLSCIVTQSAFSQTETKQLEAAELVQGECQNVTFRDEGYIVCPIKMGAHELRIFHENGEPNFWGRQVFGNFDAVNQHLQQQGEQLVFAMNGGMYHRDRSAVGLYIANGNQSQPLNTNSGPGNFHLLPNGVFYWGETNAGVMETEAYEASGIVPLFATQSGPMLVINGKLHPRFIVNSPSLKMRNGVGVDGDGTQVYFALTTKPVNFESFGLLFRDYLKTPNALFLDGGRATQIYSKNLGTNDSGERLGPIIGVVQKVERSSKAFNSTSQRDDNINAKDSAD